MIYFDDLPLDKEIITALNKYTIDYVFQPIFFPDGKTVYAWEALMRPVGLTVTELVKRCIDLGKTHIMEVATIFGAMQAYQLRGYQEKVSINSFPCECMTQQEADAFLEYYGEEIRGRMIIENLEYPFFDKELYAEKNKSIRAMDNLISIDDFGTGINDMERVELVSPDIVKLDRELISGIHRSPDKQDNVLNLVLYFHSKNMLVVTEGIEEKAEFDYLVGIGVDLFQGYYLARPA